MYSVEIWKLFASLGIPGIALALFFGLARVFQWRFASIPSRFGAPIIVLYLLLAAGLTFYALILWSPTPGKSNTIDDREVATFLALHDLQVSFSYVAQIRGVSAEAQRALPPGAIRYETTLNFMAKYFDDLTSRAYGEQKHIFQMGLLLRDSAGQINALSSTEELNAWQSSSPLTLDDIGFLIGFLHYYIYWYADETLSPDRMSSVQDGISVSHYQTASLPKMRYFLYEGAPITEYVDWLGLID